MKPADVITWTVVAIGVLPVVGKVLFAIWRGVRRLA
jgi:hypothetical protein